jgi:WD40 repeat protein
MRLLPLDPRPGRVIRCLRFAADGLSLAAVAGRPDAPQRLRRPVVYDLRTDAVLPPPPAEKMWGRVGDPAFAPDPRLTAELVAHPNGAKGVRLTDARDDPPRQLVLVGERDEHLSAAEFSADGTTLFVGVSSLDPFDGPDEHLLRFAQVDVAGWLDTGRPDRDPGEVVLDDPAPPATCFADTGGGLLAIGTTAGTAVLCDLIGGTPPLTVEHVPGTDDPPPVDAVLLSPDGRHLVTRAAGTLAVWDALTGRGLARPAAPRPFTAAAVTPDSRSLLAACMDGGVYRFAVPGYARAERLDFGHGPVYSLAVAPDGLTAAAGTAAGTAVLWDL